MALGDLHPLESQRGTLPPGANDYGAEAYRRARLELASVLICYARGWTLSATSYSLRLFETGPNSRLSYWVGPRLGEIVS